MMSEKPSPHPLLRILLMSLGILATFLGLAGIFLPLLPTTPFLLLAAFCFAKSSETFYRRLLADHRLGKYIRDYREGRGIPLKSKIISIAVLWLSISISAWILRDRPWLSALLLLIALAVTTHLLYLPTRR